MKTFLSFQYFCSVIKKMGEELQMQANANTLFIMNSVYYMELDSVYYTDTSADELRGARLDVCLFVFVHWLMLGFAGESDPSLSSTGLDLPCEMQDVSVNMISFLKNVSLSLPSRTTAPYRPYKPYANAQGSVVLLGSSKT